MDEADLIVLYGILRNWTLARIGQEMGNRLRVNGRPYSRSVVLGRVVWLSEQGYIEPDWQPYVMGSKRLTEAGRNIVRQYYGDEAFQL